MGKFTWRDPLPTETVFGGKGVLMPIGTRRPASSERASSQARTAREETQTGSRAEVATPTRAKPSAPAAAPSDRKQKPVSRRL